MPHKSPAARKAYARAYYLANREKINSAFVEWRSKNKEKRSAWEKAYYTKNKGKARDQRLENMYGVTPAQVHEMSKAQRGRCASCGDLPKKTSRNELSLHVDHCHDTQEVRGLLCLRCNAALGFLRDDPDRVKKLLAYITRPRLRRVA